MARGAEGSLALYEPAQGVFYLRVDGYYAKRMYDEGFAPAIARAIDRGATIRLFADWWDMTSYDSAVRSASTEWSLAHRAQVAHTGLLVRSRVVAMGVNTAAMLLALSGISLEVHATTGPFERSLEAAIRGVRSMRPPPLE